MIQISEKQIQLIAEAKTHSPFGFDSSKTWEELFKIANEYGDIISIHTDPRWNGSFDLIRKAKSLTSKPILAKGIHDTDDLIQKAVESGADFVLVVGRIPAVHTDKCIIEPNSLEELKALPHNMKVVWNSRDLKTGCLKKETFVEARKIFPGWLCQASNIKSIEDVEKEANAVLVGESLEKFVQSLH